MPESCATDLLRTGLEYHKVGRLADAEACYRRILAAQPENAAALHLLGLLAHQVGRHAAAAELIQRALRHDGENAVYLSDLGAVLKDQRRLDEAITALRQAIRIKPGLAPAHCNLGAALRDRGKLDEAAAACRQAIRLRPDHAEGYSNLGVVLHDQGQLDEAIVAFSQALRITPAAAECHLNLGHALRAQGRRDEAVAAYRQAIRASPTFAQAYSCLGALLGEQGRLDESIAACRQAVGIRPDHAEGWCNLGIALCARGRFDQAIAAHREAIRIRPDYAEAHSALGSALRAHGDLDDAIASHREAVRLRPDRAEAWSNLGRALHDQNLTAEAIEAFRQAIALDPASAEAHNSLGAALRALGRLPEARAALKSAVRLAPGNAAYQRNLSEIARFVAGNSRLAVMEQLAANGTSLSIDDRIELHFALGKAYEDLGRHAEAFRQWLHGGALKRQQVSYDEAATLAGLERIKDVFTPELIGKWRGIGQPSSTPIFVVGMMRSGTTLVEQILASHPRVFPGGEMKHFAAAVSEIRAAPGAQMAFPGLVPEMVEPDFRDLGARYLAQIVGLAPGAAHITDKMPGNFVFAGLIHLALPNAVIVHTVRDPVDTCLSCFSKLFGAEQNYTYDLAELGRYYRGYRELMAHWHRVLPAGRILDVRYEDVVADLEGQARRLLAHCGLEWDARCLAFHQTERPVRTASATQVRQPIYDKSIGRWRAHENFLGPLLAALGTAKADD